MAAVIFNPDGGTRRRPRQGAGTWTGQRTARGTGIRTALVLGAGGVLGGAWMTGALASLADRLPCAPADVDLIVGTSVGSVFAAALRCHAGLEEMVAWQRGEATGILGESAALAAQDGPLPPLPHLRVGSVPLARAGLLKPWQVPPWVAATGWLPHGRGQHAALRSLVDALCLREYPRDRSEKTLPAWADNHTWISAVDYDSGQRVLFGAVGAPPAPLADAVAASCSIPGWYAPARIGGRRYVDGGVRSATSLGALRGTDVRDVYVLAPMASTEPDHPFQPHLRLERRFRQVQTSVLLRQARTLSAEGKRVTVLTPGPADLAAMGMNLMDPRRREAVLDISFRTCAESLSAVGRSRPHAA